MVWLRRRLGNFTIAAVLAYLVATTAFLIWRGISVSPDYFVFILLLGAIILGRWRDFVVDWMPFIALLLGYEFLRGLAGSSGIAVHYQEVISADRLLGFGNLPTLWLQQHLHQPGRPSALDYATTVFYFLHFAYPLTLGYVFWFYNRPMFRRFAAALLLMSFGCFVFFLLVPVAPPWLASQHGYLPHIDKIISSTIPSDTTWFYEHLNPNPVAAFPSLHEAFPVLGLLYGLRIFGRSAWPLALWCAAVCFSIVYLGEHYLIDAIAGVLVALLACATVETVADRLASAKVGKGGASGQGSPTGRL
jgi:membrane-associated phospholipid phosphatase